MNFIEHVREPRRLLLVWQRPEEDGAPRIRRAVAELVREPGAVRFRYLTDTPDFACAVQEGFVNFPAFRKLSVTYDLGVLDVFMRRLPPRSRGDYAQYLEQFRLRPETPISDFALLAYTGATLPSDGFGILDPLDDVVGDCDLLLTVAGVRHRMPQARTDLGVGMPATFIPESDNAHDPDAVAVAIAGERVGYVPRQQARGVRGLLATGNVQASVARVNGTAARPQIRLLVRWTRATAEPAITTQARRTITIAP